MERTITGRWQIRYAWIGCQKTIKAERGLEQGVMVEVRLRSCHHAFDIRLGGERGNRRHDVQIITRLQEFEARRTGIGAAVVHIADESQCSAGEQKVELARLG